MLSGFQIIETDPILPSPHSIDGESQVTIIGTDRQIANAAKIKAFGHSIDIQKNTDVAGIFGRGSTINRVLLAVLTFVTSDSSIILCLVDFLIIGVTDKEITKYPNTRKIIK